jgi:hypothetical protein
VPTFDYSSYSKRLENLCNRLKQAGLRVQSTRLDSYRKAISDFDKVPSGDQLREWASPEKIGLLYNDLEESQEVLEACDQFYDLGKPGLLARLEKILSGPRELAKETSDKGKARNTLFELVVAGRLKKAGLEVDLDRIEDVRFTFFDRLCFIDDFLFVCQDDQEVSHKIRQHLKAFIDSHRDAFQSARDREKRALAIYTYLRLPVAVLGRNGLWIAKTVSVYLLDHSRSKDGKLTLQFQKRLQASENP